MTSEGAEFYHLRQHPEFDTLFPELGTNSKREPIKAKDIEEHFKTDNWSASLAVCQLAALALKVDIHIQRLSTPDVGPIILPGGLPSDGGSRPTIRLLLRENFGERPSDLWTKPRHPVLSNQARERSIS
jgi:hypothetical protein